MRTHHSSGRLGRSIVFHPHRPVASRLACTGRTHYTDGTRINCQGSPRRRQGGALWMRSSSVRQLEPGVSTEAHHGRARQLQHQYPVAKILQLFGHGLARRAARHQTRPWSASVPPCSQGRSRGAKVHDERVAATDHLQGADLRAPLDALLPQGRQDSCRAEHSGHATEETRRAPSL